MSRLGAALALLLAWSMPAATLCGQDWTDLQSAARFGVDLQFKLITGNRFGGYGYLLLEGENQTAEARQFVCSYQSSSWSDVDAGAQMTAVLPPSARGRWFLPVPSVPGADGNLFVDLGGAALRESIDLGRKSGPALLLVTGRPDRTAPAAAWVGMGDLTVVAPVELPPDWSYLSVFRTVLVDNTAGLDQAAQEVLRRYAFAGGTVVVVGGSGEALRAGALRQRLETAGPGALGVGRLEQIYEYDDGVPGHAYQDLVVEDARIATKLPTRWLTCELPGIGQVPVRAFLVVILVFAVVLGPVNFAWLRRRRRPMLALVTVPLIGFSTMLAILTYGLLHDGLGTRGVMWSASLLDQREHQAVTMASRTLFAGMATGELSAPSGVVVEAWEAMNMMHSRGSGVRARFDLDRQVLEGSALPARTPTNIMTTQQGIARARVRLRRVDAGAEAYELLADAEFRPVDGTPLILRDFAGEYYQREAGRLLRCGEDVAAARLREIVALADTVAARNDQQLMIGRAATFVQAGDRGGQIDALLLPEGMLPGSFLGVFESLPWQENHGLSVEWLQQVHIVRCDLAEEDVVQ